MQPKKGDFSDIQSIYGIDCFMSKDFIFLLLHLINYPDVFPQDFSGERLTKLRFEKMSWKNCIQFLIALQQETHLKMVVTGNKQLLTKINVSRQAAKDLERVINTYLNKFSASELKPLSENAYSFEKQKEYFIDAIQKKLDSGFTETFVFSDSEVETGYNLFEGLLVLEQQKYLTIENIYNCQDRDAKDYYKIRVCINKRKFRMTSQEKKPINPYCVEEKGTGYLKFHKNGKKIKISRITSNPYKLLHFLIDPFGAARTIDATYKILTKRKQETTDEYLGLNRKITTIGNTIKELQKVPGFSEHLKIRIDSQSKHVRLCQKDQIE